MLLFGYYFLLSNSVRLLEEIRESVFDLEKQIEVTKEQLFDDVEELKILIK